jgi:hypothetical protein
MGIGLLENDGVLVCKYIESSSFLCGHLNPGDLITAANGVEAKSAPRIAAECKQVDRVTLHVHSPLPHADHVCFVKPNDRSALGFTVSKDPKTGFAMVAQIAPSAHVRATEPWDLELGERGGLPLALNDLILAVGHGGTSYAVDSPKEANARLKAAAAGALIELRVLRAASSYAVGAEKGALARVPSAPSPASSTRASAVQRIEAPHTKEGPPTITDVDSSFDSSSGSDMGDRSTVCATPLREGAAWAAHLREGGAEASGAQKLLALFAMEAAGAELRVASEANHAHAAPGGPPGDAGPPGCGRCDGPRLSDCRRTRLNGLDRVLQAAANTRVGCGSVVLGRCHYRD